MCGIVAMYSARGPIPAGALGRANGLPALGADARAALDPVLMILLSACCLHQRYFQGRGFLEEVP
jgi:hypothetical protein